MAVKRSSRKRGTARQGRLKPAGRVQQTVTRHPSTGKPLFPVVAIGASAGGLEAFMTLLDQLPAQSGMAFVLIQHLDPSHESMLVELLSRHTAMPMAEIVDGGVLEPGHVYVIPPKAQISVAAGAFHVSVVRGGQGARYPFDSFLTSLAEECGERAIGVILTGTGSDGSIGLRAVNEHGGLVIAQDPVEAAHDGMPRNAIETGAVDLIFPLAEIADALVRRGRQATQTIPASKSTPHTEAAAALAEILALVARTASRDFVGYKETTLLRRIQRRMVIRRSRSSSEYVRLLQREPAEIASLVKDMLIHVTRFFRDAKEYEALVSTVIPALVHEQPLDQPLRVWVAGCSTGQEAYSLAILFFEEMARSGRSLKLQIFATDVEEDAIAFARRGLYPDAIQSEVNPARLGQFFVKEDHHYCVSPQLREATLFTVHDVLSDPPFSRLDLISCRNLLIYLRSEIQEKIIALFHFSLRANGILFLGISETPGEASELFGAISPTHHVYRRIGQARPRRLDFPVDIVERTRALWPATTRAPERRIDNLGDIALRQLADAYAPASVLINSKRESLYHFGPIDRFLKVAAGEFSRDLLTMARDNLGPKLRIAIRQATQRHETVTLTSAEIKRDGKSFFVTLVVKPAEIEGQQLLLVSFFDGLGHGGEASRAPNSPIDGARIAELEKEVATTRKELEQTIRNLESANIELTASNEEAMSVNEEFHSTNEELQTSKEELQSLNEELTVLNNQLQEAIHKQREASDDLQNILNSADIATLFLDRDFHVRFFTPAAKALFGVIVSDIGRPLNNLALPFTDISLLDDARQVLESLAPHRREITTEKGAWYARRVLPYRTQDDRIQGVIVTFTDISSMKAVEARIRAAQVYAEGIINAIREPLAILDENMRIRSASASFYGYFGATAEDSVGRTLSEADGHHLNVPRLGPFIDQIRSGVKEIRDYQIELEAPGIGHRTVGLSTREIDGQPDGQRLILVSMEDITEHLAAEQALVGARKAAELANSAKSRFLAAASHDLRQPLQTLRLLRGIFEQKVTDKDLLSLTRRAGETLDTISQMLDLILDINQLEAGVVQPRIVDFSIGDLLNRLRNEFAIHTEAADLDWRVVSSQKIVRSDPTVLEQMIRNLLSNAVKYTKQGKVLLGCRRHGRKLSIEVWDTGPGIPDNELHAIFEEFHQTNADVAHDQGRGLGLGLSIVQRLSELMGHAIGVRSRVGKGSVFSIEVPLGDEEGKKRRPPERTTSEDSPQDPVGTILVIEDDVSVREMLGMFLRGLGHRVGSAGSGEEALDLLKKREVEPDLLIVDYTLPGRRNGLDVIASLRSALRGNIPAIVLSGDVSAATLRAIAQRGDPYLTKPVATGRISALIRQLLTKHNKKLAPVIEQLEKTQEASLANDGNTKTVFVVDDDHALREALQELLELSGYRVMAFASGEAFLRAVDPGLRGCLLLDARMPGMDGIEVLNQLRARSSLVTPIMITGKGDVATAVEAMKGGAVDFIEKPVGNRKLIAIVDRALAQAGAASDDSDGRARAAHRLASLTKRQREILDLISAGHANKEIAARLHINQRTVESHRALVMKRLGAKSFAELIRMALVAS